MHPIVIFKGGLGNQLFQWSFAHSVDGGGTFYPARFHYALHDKIRQFELGNLAANCSHILGDANVSLPHESFAKVAEWAWKHSKHKEFVEIFFRYFQEDPRNDQLQSESKRTKQRIYSGYFQNSQNVELSLEMIKREVLSHTSKIAPTLKTLHGLPEEYSSIHIRTGDYSSGNSTSSNFIGNLHQDYFLEGVRKMKANFLVVLTENANQISRLLQEIKPDLVLDSEKLDAWETLAVLSESKSMAGANSSLSWWGARLASLNGADVWLPQNWTKWNNINSANYRFRGLNLLESKWRNE